MRKCIDIVVSLSDFRKVGGIPCGSGTVCKAKLQSVVNEIILNVAIYFPGALTTYILWGVHPPRNMTDTKRLAFSIVQFLHDQLNSGGLSSDTQESLEGRVTLVWGFLRSHCFGGQVGLPLFTWHYIFSSSRNPVSWDSLRCLKRRRTSCCHPDLTRNLCLSYTLCKLGIVFMKFP